MAKFESFDNSTQKFQKIWEKNEENKSEIDNNLKRIEVNFNSENFNKKINTIPIITDREQDDLDEIFVIDLNDFPEWIINHINVVLVIELVGDVNTDTIISSSNDENAKVGDIVYGSGATNGKYWIAKLDENNYKLKVLLDITVRRITDIPPVGSPTTEKLFFNLNLNLVITNPRIYENTNQQKS